MQFANSESKLLLIPFDWISLFSRIKVKSLDTFCYKPKKLSTLSFYFSQCLFTYDIDILGEFWVNKTLRSTEQCWSVIHYSQTQKPEKNPHTLPVLIYSIISQPCIIHRHKQKPEKNPHTLPVVMYCITSQPCIIYRHKLSNFSCMIYCFPEYTKIFKNMLLLDWCYNVKPSTQIKHCCLFQTDQSTTWWWKKCCCYG